MTNPSVVLSPQQRDKIRSHLAAFRNYMGSDQFRRDQQDRQDRVRYFQKELPSKLASLSEADIEELVTGLNPIPISWINWNEDGQHL